MSSTVDGGSKLSSNNASFQSSKTTIEEVDTARINTQDSSLPRHLSALQHRASSAPALVRTKVIVFSLKSKRYEDRWSFLSLHGKDWLKLNGVFPDC